MRWDGSNRISTTRSARCISCGITSVVDVGGPKWNFGVREKSERDGESTALWLDR